MTLYSTFVSSFLSPQCPLVGEKHQGTAGDQSASIKSKEANGDLLLGFSRRGPGTVLPYTKLERSVASMTLHDVHSTEVASRSR